MPRFLLALAFLVAASAATAQDFDTAAKQAILIDADNGSVLYQKNADELMPPASMAKLMTLEVVFDRLKSGALTLDDEFRITPNAWQQGGASSGGSTMFAKVNSDVRLEDLLKGIIVVSANDASIAIGEGLAGTDSAFGGLMTERARRIGLERSVFKNSTGLPHPEQLVTARELAQLGRYLIKTYPEYYDWFAEPSFKWNNIEQSNRNPLLGDVSGADGLKTGYTQASGYGLVGSAEKDGRRLILVLNGLESKRAREAEAVKLMNWGFRAFQLVDLLDADGPLGEALVFGGVKSGVAVRPEGKLQLYMPVGRTDRVRAEIVFDGPIPAPVREGQRVGKLQIMIGDRLSQETPLYAAEDVAVGSVPDRALSAARELVTGLFH